MKAIIISHEDDGSYVMDREGSFRFVKGYSSRPVGMEIEIAAKAPTSRMRLTAIAASFFLVLALTGFAWTWNTQKYSVYMDINPSLELVFNGFDRLIAVNALNEDGETLLRDLNLRGMPGDAVLGVVKAANSAGYLDGSTGSFRVLVTVVTDDSGLSARQIALIDKALAADGFSGLAAIQACSTDLCQRAMDLGMSPGRLLLIERLLDADDSLAFEDLANQPIKTLLATAKDVGLAQKDPKVAEDTSDDNPNKGPNQKSVGDDDNANKGPGNNSGNSEDNANKGPGNNSGSSSSNNSGNTEDNPNKGPNENSVKDDENQNKGPGNNSGSTSSNNSGNPDDNPNKGPGNNSGNTEANENQGPDNNSGNSEDNPNKGPNQNSIGEDDNENKGPGNNSGNPEDNSNKGPGNNSGNKDDNPNKGPGKNSGKQPMK